MNYPPEEVARQPVLEGRVGGEPSPAVVAEMMLAVEEQEFDPDARLGER